MTDLEIKAVKSAYQRAYYAKNKERIRENQRRYWERKAQKLREVQNQNEENQEESHE